MADGDIRLLPFTLDHRDALRAACAKDPAIWEIYPVNMLGAGLDEKIARFHGGGWVGFSIFSGDALVGTSSYINPDTANGSVEIGGTYIEPSVRGGDFNRRIKHLMLDRAFAVGFRRVQFNVDTRNQRSMAALRKLGATYEGTLRSHRVTWTGYVRDTAVFSILADEWHATHPGG
ncbi:MAG TPA: GNAT family protein [Sphingobium sp.]|uniref:GNAT family N-acetyltransferase n=1 Tax=Sphingobium sp. TaxID=1912891 RepID=UPI002ED1ADD7